MQWSVEMEFSCIPTAHLGKVRLALCPTMKKERTGTKHSPFPSFLIPFYTLIPPLDCFSPHFLYFLTMREEYYTPQCGSGANIQHLYFSSVPFDSGIKDKISCDSCCHREKNEKKTLNCIWGPERNLRGHLKFHLQHPCQVTFRLLLA